MNISIRRVLLSYVSDLRSGNEGELAIHVECGHVSHLITDFKRKDKIGNCRDISYHSDILDIVYGECNDVLDSILMNPEKIDQITIDDEEVDMNLIKIYYDDCD